MSSFHSYASDHGGWYPAGEATPLEALQLLYKGNYATANQMAGVTGPAKETKKRLEDGGNLDESISSWVYWPGFRNDDQELLIKLLQARSYNLKKFWQGDIAILWERTPGFTAMGSRSSDKGLHAVLFIMRGRDHISGNDWEEFVKQQEEYRRVIMDYRNQISSTNAPAPKAD